MQKIWIAGSVLMAGSMAFLLPAQEPASTALKQKGQKGPATAETAFAGYKVVTGSPFSAIEVTTMTQTLANGNRIVRNNQRKVYRASQGRERVEQEPTMSVLGEQVAVANVMIADPGGGRELQFGSVEERGAKKEGWNPPAFAGEHGDCDGCDGSTGDPNQGAASARHD